MADERVWRFEFVDVTPQANSGISNNVESGINASTDSEKKSKNEFMNRFIDKTQGDLIKTAVMTPLNSSVGRVASPIYMAGKRMVHGASVGSAVGVLASQLLMIAIDELGKKVEDIQNKVRELNNADNSLIRAGSVSKASYYSGNIFGIKKKTDRS